MPKFQNPLEFPNQLFWYYRKRPELKKVKGASKLPQKYIGKIYRLASNKTTREMPEGLIAIKINIQLKDDNILDKNGKNLQ